MSDRDAKHAQPPPLRFDAAATGTSSLAELAAIGVITPREARGEPYMGDPGDEDDRVTRLLASPLLTKHRTQDDEYSRGWNAACAAMRALLESP